MDGTTGWHIDPDDPAVSRYWDGQGWTGELRWDGGQWVDGTGTTTTAPADAQPPAAVASTQAAVAGFARTMTTTSWLLFGGAAVAAVGVALPWEHVSSAFGQESQTPTSLGGAAFLLLGLAAGVVWAGWTSRTRAVSVIRRVLLVLLAASMGFFVVAKFNAIGRDQDLARRASVSSSYYGSASRIEVSAGLGLYLWTTGTILVIVGVVFAFRSRSGSSARP